MSELFQKTKEICRIFDISPRRSKGQNFLITEDVYDEMIKVADIKPDDIVIEVGPGLGFLTARLAQKAKKVIAIELDDKLSNVLQTAIDSQEIDNIEVLNQDVLKFNFNALEGNDYKIVANLPYNISSIFLRQVLSLRHKPKQIVLMLQKEVVERIIARPPKMNLLAILVQLHARPKLVYEVKAKNFWPQPKVDSAIVNIEIEDHNLIKEEEKLFWRLLRAGFSAKRKMLKNNLASSLQIEQKIIEKTLIKMDLNPKIRAEKLEISQWQDLFGDLKGFMV